MDLDDLDQKFTSKSSLGIENIQRSTLDNKKYQQITDITHLPYQPFYISVKTKNFSSIPAFGSAAVRKIPEFNGNESSDKGLYQRISYEKNGKFLNPYQQIKQKKNPFITAAKRFQIERIKGPGPGQYNIPHLFSNQKILKQSQNKTLFSNFEKKQYKKYLSCCSNRQKQHDLCQQRVKHPFITKENYEFNHNYFKQIIKKKRNQTRLKIFKIKQKMKNPQTAFDLIKIKSTSKYQSIPYQNKQNQKNQKKKKLNSNKTIINLKQMTDKYLPKFHYNFEREQYQADRPIYNFRDKYSNQSIFLSKNQNLFSSYISKNQVPGPGTYGLKQNKLERKQTLNIHNFFT